MARDDRDHLGIVLRDASTRVDRSNQCTTVGDARAISVGETSRLHSSYERGCQEKTFLPAPREDAGVVTYIQPHLILKGVLVLAAFVRRAFQRRCQPQLLIPTRRFHEAVALDAIRFRSYASEGRREEILRRRAEQKQRTIDQRLRYNLGRWNQKPRVELKLKP